jgi:hypothetical protein
MLITLALGLVAAGAITRVLMKIADARRASVMIDHPESDWVDERSERRNGPEQRFVDEAQDHTVCDRPMFGPKHGLGEVDMTRRTSALAAGSSPALSLARPLSRAVSHPEGSGFTH